MKISVEISFDTETGQYAVEKSTEEMAEGMGGMPQGMPPAQGMPATPDMAQPGAEAPQTFQSVDEALQAAKQILSTTDEATAMSAERKSVAGEVWPQQKQALPGGMA